jgi:hypothetical protein
MLIDDFSTFYLGRIAIFKHATHVLDMEESIRDRFRETPLTSGGEPVTHYRFADSKAEPGIQLADIVVGVLGKMHSYFTETPSDEVAADRANLTGTCLQNSELLRNLIAASHDANIAFLHHVSSCTISTSWIYSSASGPVPTPPGKVLTTSVIGDASGFASRRIARQALGSCDRHSGLTPVTTIGLRDLQN